MTDDAQRGGNSTRCLELSVVMPCLDEADTLRTCIEKAQRAMAEHDIAGEIIVADNGSRDGSIEIAERAGARARAWCTSPSAATALH